MEQMISLLPEWLGQRARLSPNRLAVIVGDRSRTYADLDRDVSEFGQWLQSLGVKGGDRIALLMRNGYAFVLATHATMRVGAILVPLNARLTAAEMAWQVDDSQASFLLFDAHHASTAQDIGTRVVGSVVAHLVVEAQYDMTGREGASESQQNLAGHIDLSAVQSIVYTSGTTGVPKGAMITFGNLWWSAIGSALNLGNQIDDRWLACLPLFHVGGMSILFRSVIYGISTVVHESFDALAVNRAIDDHDITIVSVVSTMLQRMLDARGEHPYPRSLRCVLLGGGPASQQLLADCAKRNMPVVQTYGLTEAASQVATLAPEESLRKLGSAGKPLFPTELRIERDGMTARPGDIGEIMVSGPTVSPGYFNRPDATASTLRNGWLHTGDLGYLDDEGFLYVVDRRDDLVVSGGENVYPAEVEKVLREHPSVAEAVVVGLPDPQWGQSVAAVIQLRAGATAETDDVLEYCRERLAGYKVPRHIRYLDDIPRNATGKILRRTLRDNWPPVSATT